MRPKKRFYLIFASVFLFVILSFFASSLIYPLVIQKSDISIKNVQSYPVVGGNWEVEFETSGMADLTIRAVNGTSFSFDNLGDLDFVDLRCGKEAISYEIVKGSIFVKNYECDKTSFEISNVFTIGDHHLEFSFGDSVSYASNDAISEAGYRTQQGIYYFSGADEFIELDFPVKNISRAFVIAPNQMSQADTTAATSGTPPALNSDDSLVSLYLYNETHIRVQRSTADYDVVVTWQILEALDEEFYVQRGSYDFSGTDTSVSDSIPESVEANNSLSWYYLNTTSTSRDGLVTQFFSNVTDSNTITFERTSGTNMVATIRWVVVEWDMSKIDGFFKGYTGSITGGDTTPDCFGIGGTVNTSHSILLHYSHAVTSGGLDSSARAGYIQDEDNVCFYDYDGSNDASVNWYLIEFPSSSQREEDIQTDWSTTDYSDDPTFTGTFPLNNSLLWLSGTCNGDGTAKPRHTQWWYFNDNGTHATGLHVERTYGGQNREYSWQVLELPYYINPDAPEFNDASVNESVLGNGGIAKFNVSVTDASDSISGVNGTIGGDNYSFSSGAGDEWNSEYICISNGTFDFSFVVAEDDGYPVNVNSSLISDVSLVCDLDAPLINFGGSSFANYTYVSQNFFIADVDIEEPNFANLTFGLHNSSGIVNETTFTDSTRTITWINLLDGIYFYNSTVFDLGANSNSTETRIITLDTTNPLIEFSEGTEDNNSAISQDSIFVNVSVDEINEANITFVLFNSTEIISETTHEDNRRDITWTLLPDGTYFYNVTLVDLALNENATETRKIILDNVLPVVDFGENTPENNANLSQNYIFVNASVDEDNLENVTFGLYNSGGVVNETTFTDGTLDINFTGLSDGIYYYNITVVDVVKNAVSSSTRKVTLDTTIPLLEYGLGTASHDSNLSQNYIFVNASVDEDNLENVTFGLYNSGGVVNETTFNDGTLDINFTGLAGGNYSYNISVLDFSGNVNFTSTNFIVIDYSGPTVEIILPEPTTYGENTSLPMNYTVSDDIVGYSSCWWNIDDGSNNSLVCGENATFDTNDGAHTIKVYSNDTLGNVGYAEVLFSISTMGPAVVLEAPANGTVFSDAGLISLNYSAFGPEGMTNCSLYGDWNGGWHQNQSQKGNWWNDSWNYRKKLNISVDSDVTDDYTVDILLATTGDHFLDNGDDVRVTFWNGTSFIELDRLIVRPNESDSQVQFRLQRNITAGDFDEDYAIYYGNPSAGTPPKDAENVWFFYDDFSDGNYDKWAYGSGTYMIDTTHTNPWTEQDSVLQLGSCDNSFLKVNETYFTPTRDLKIRALWMDNPDLTCGSDPFAGSPDADGILGLRGSMSTTYDGLLVEWDTDTGFHYDLGATGSVAADYSDFDVWHWTESVAYGTDASGHKAKHWNFNESEPDTYSLQATAVTATGAGLPYLRVASGTALVSVVFASILIENEPVVTIQDEDWVGEFIMNFSQDGTYIWNVECVDNNDVGNFAVANYTFILDFNAPGIEFSIGTAMNNSNLSQNYIFSNVSIVEENLANVTFNLYDENSDLVSSDAFSDGTTEHTWYTLDSGIYYYNVSAIDKTSRENWTETRMVTLDTTSPNAVLLEPTNGSFFSSLIHNFTVSLSDNLNLRNATLYIFNEAKEIVFTNTIAIVGASVILGEVYEFVSDGTFTWFYKVFDWSGNSYETENRTMTIDSTNPYLDYGLGVEENNSAFSRDWIFVNVSVNETNEANITFVLFNSSQEIYSNSFSDSRRDLTWTLLPDGTYFYNVTLVDLALNENATETRTITLDNVYPLIEYGVGTYEDNVNFSRDWIFVNVSVSEINEANITFSLYNSSGIVNETTFTDSTRSINWTGLSDEDYYYNVTVMDAVALSNFTFTQKVILDTTFPQIDFSFGTESNNSNLSQNFIFVNLSLDDLHFNNLTFGLYNSSGIVNETTFTDSTRSINWTGLLYSNVTYYFNATTFDFSGNVNSTSTWEVMLYDSISPKLFLIKPLNKTYTSNESLELVYLALDDHLNTCKYSLDGGANITLLNCANTTFSVSDESSHTIELYVNDSSGNSNYSSVTFFVNTSLIFTDLYKVQRGSSNVDGTRDVSVDVTDSSKAFILFTSRSSDAGPDSLQVTGTFLNSETIRLENYESGAGGDVDWEIISGPGIFVQRGEVSYGTSNSAFNVSINPINLSSSFVIVNARVNSGTGSDNVQGFWKAEFVDSDTVQFTRGTSGTSGYFSWQVVDWENVTVQSGSVTMASSTTGSDTLSNSVDLSKSFLIFSSNLASDTSIQDIFTRGYLSDSSTVNFERTGNGGTLGLEYFVLESNLFQVQSSSYTHLTQDTVQYDYLSDTLINLSRSFNVHSHENTGTGTTFSNGFVSQRLIDEDTLGIQKGTSSNGGQTNWFVIEIREFDAPNVSLVFPTESFNFSDYFVGPFSYNVSDSQTISNCSLYGNWSSGWHLNQTILTPSKLIINNFSNVSVSMNDYYIWDVECTDAYGNVGRNTTNFSFSAFYLPEEPVISNISQGEKDGTGNVTLFWESANNSYKYNIYYSDNLTDFVYLNETFATNYTDNTFSGNMRRFYYVESWNPVGTNQSADYFGRHVYSLNHNSVGTKNLIGFPTNFSYLPNANTTYRDINSSVSLTMYNSSSQNRVTCNEYSCPDSFSCTVTNCNFEIERGRGYELNLNSSGISSMNWSGVGIVYSPASVTLEKVESNYGKNWVSMYAGTTLSDARDLKGSISNSDAVTRWDSESQISQGLIELFPGFYLGGFDIKMEEGYEVSVTSNTSWVQE